MEKHDWTIIKISAVLCSKCRMVKMPHSVDTECNEEFMNNKDKEAFKEWYINKESEFDNCKESWQAACEYKRLEYKARIEELEIAYKSNQEAALMSAILSDKNRCLEAENKKLRKALALILEVKDYHAKEIAREALKEVSEK